MSILSIVNKIQGIYKIRNLLNWKIKVNIELNGQKKLDKKWEKQENYLIQKNIEIN